MLTTSIICLALNVYFEAQAEPLAGQLLVAETTLNRVHSPKWPNTICDVVYQPAQFSWVTQHRVVLSDKVFQQSLKLAQSYTYKPSCITHFYNSALYQPKWANSMHVRTVVGGHTFLCK